MVLDPIDEEIRKIRKKYLSGIPRHSKSKCCGEQTVLFQYSEGGFVKCKCQKCGEEETLSDIDFENLDLRIECPKCKKPMKPGRIVYSNYGYRCEGCDLEIKLADLLPRERDL